MTKHTITYDEVFGSGLIVESFASSTRAGVGFKRLYAIANFHNNSFTFIVENNGEIVHQSEFPREAIDKYNELP